MQTRRKGIKPDVALVTWTTNAGRYGHFLSIPSIAVIQVRNLQQGLYDCMDELQRRNEWLIRKQPEPWAALVMSDNIRNFYGRTAGQVEERYLANVFGTFRAVVEVHLPTTVISDWNLTQEDLSRYKVLILANTACLDDRQVAAVREFVANGGGLVASQDASMFDEFGTPRNNFALADVFGADYRGLLTNTAESTEQLDVNFAKAIGPDYWEKRKNVFDFRQDPDSFLNQGKMRTYVDQQLVTFKGPAVKVQPQSAHQQVFGHIRFNNSPVVTDYPAIMTQQYGKGRVVCFAAGLDAGYYLYADPYQRLALKHAVTWAANELPPIQVTAPMCVHSTIMRQSTATGSRLIVHLFNNLNTTAHHALPIDDVPLREETVPIHHIQIAFNADYAVTRVAQQPEGKELPLTKTADGVTVTVPKLDIHTMVVAELQEPPVGTSLPKRADFPHVSSERVFVAPPSQARG